MTTAPVLEAFVDSDIVIGLVCPVGTDTQVLTTFIADRLAVAGYVTETIRVSKDVIPRIIPLDVSQMKEGERIAALMTAGSKAREVSADSGILADGCASAIAKFRSAKEHKRRAFIINSLKHPDEVLRLRQLYPGGFYLIGVQPDESIRRKYLEKQKAVDTATIDRLIERDRDERIRYGQRLNDTFHLADFFVRVDGDDDQLRNNLERVFDLLFGDPYVTPTFDEFAMFLAFASSLRSADLSRQVGAVIARKDEIISTGANDCPRFGGGLYWPKFDPYTKTIQDFPDGRDYKRGRDSNREKQDVIIDAVVKKGIDLGLNERVLRETLAESPIRDITEYGRVVHAEMEALLSCARNSVTTREATLFCTTFPCHNCAKHIIAAGITRIVFIEPYSKSKAAEFHADAITVGPAASVSGKLPFEPFIGVGPRRFFDLFSIRLGAGYELKRKGDDGKFIPWELTPASRLRIQMLPRSYRDLEDDATKRFEDQIQALTEVKGEGE